VVEPRFVVVVAEVVVGCVTGPTVVVEGLPPPSPERIRRTAIVTPSRNAAGAA